ncbi:hypothetical protein ACS4RR_011595 [Rhizobium sp. Z1P35]|uniref:hypothetical protein n=1 Tax=Rhizobium sp. SRDI969 TaxID=3138252 RepID=UPI0021A567A4|nr:hypothetical protein [Rhizobium leguminosarum]UWM79653.1 hypothetical protein N2A41_13005 [Rhizobium leguminosarum bv. viciae]
MRVRLMLPHEDAVARVLRAALEVIGGVTTTWIVMIGERMTRVPPLHPLAMLVDPAARRPIWACQPCVASRGYIQEDMLDGGIVVSASAMHVEIRQVR